MEMVRRPKAVAPKASPRRTSLKTKKQPSLKQRRRNIASDKRRKPANPQNSSNTLSNTETGPEAIDVPIPDQGRPRRICKAPEFYGEALPWVILRGRRERQNPPVSSTNGVSRIRKQSKSTEGNSDSSAQSTSASTEVDADVPIPASSEEAGPSDQLVAVDLCTSMRHEQVADDSFQQSDSEPGTGNTVHTMNTGDDDIVDIGGSSLETADSVIDRPVPFPWNIPVEIPSLGPAYPFASHAQYVPSVPTAYSNQYQNPPPFLRPQIPYLGGPDYAYQPYSYAVPTNSYLMDAMHCHLSYTVRHLAQTARGFGSSPTTTSSGSTSYIVDVTDEPDNEETVQEANSGPSTTSTGCASWPISPDD